MSAKPTDNLVIISGKVGKVEERDGGITYIRLCHKDGYWDEKAKAYKSDDNWFSINFFGKRAQAAARDIKLSDLIQVEGALVQWPKEGPESRTRINGKSFKIVYIPNYGHGGEIDEPKQ